MNTQHLQALHFFYDIVLVQKPTTILKNLVFCMCCNFVKLECWCLNNDLYPEESLCFTIFSSFHHYWMARAFSMFLILSSFWKLLGRAFYLYVSLNIFKVFCALFFSFACNLMFVALHVRLFFRQPLHIGLLVTFHYCLVFHAHWSIVIVCIIYGL